MIKYEDIITIQEFMFYLPYLNNISDIIYDTEKVKPIFEYMSVLTETKFGGIGSSEGLGLSYVIYKNGLLADKFDKKYFK
jgi:hypothetical protein